MQMSGLASDLNNTQFVGASNPDAVLTVRFYIRPLKNEFRSAQEARPIFEDVLFINIVTPGNALNEIDRIAREDDKVRFPLHWAHFQNTQGADAKGIGTPLSQWPALSPSQIEELRALKFTTVESVANASDQQIANIGMCGGMAPQSFRQAARNYLVVAKDASALAKQAEEVAKLKAEQDAKDAAHKAEMDELREQLAALKEAVQSQPEKRGPGRPRVVEAA